MTSVLSKEKEQEIIEQMGQLRPDQGAREGLRQNEEV
jgi:hypothetical protein